MQHNILITSAGKRVALTKYFKETLNRFYPEAKFFTTDMNPEMDGSCCVRPKVCGNHVADMQGAEDRCPFVAQ